SRESRMPKSKTTIFSGFFSIFVSPNLCLTVIVSFMSLLSSLLSSAPQPAAKTAITATRKNNKNFLGIVFTSVFLFCTQQSPAGRGNGLCVIETISPFILLAHGEVHIVNLFQHFRSNDLGRQSF